MSLRTTIESLAKTAPPPKFRAAHGQWVPYAWMVRGLAEAGQPIMEAVRIVVREMSLTPPDLAIRSIRQAYYAIRNKPWPEEAVQAEYGVTGEQLDTKAERMEKDFAKAEKDGTLTQVAPPPTPAEALAPAAKALSAYPLADEDFIV